jgi:hypothetical protein
MNVEFDDNQKELLYAQIAESQKPTGIPAFLIDKGLAKDEKAASTVMSIGALIILALAGFVTFTFLL